MRKTKQPPKRGGQPGNQNALGAGRPPGEEKKLYSARVTLETATKLEADAEKAGVKPSAWVAELLEAHYKAKS